MKHALSILIVIAALCAAAQAQTLRTVMVDTNGVQSGFFGAGAQTNLSLKVGATNSGFFSSIGGLNAVRAGTLIWTASGSAFNMSVPIAFSGANAATNAATSRVNLGLGWSPLTNTNATGFYTSTLTAYSMIQAALAEDDITAREDLNIPLPALTNTSNVTMMRALAGSTNTNQPFSGTLYYTDPEDSTGKAIEVQNGIIVNVYVGP